MFEYKDEYDQDSPFFPILLMFRYRMTVRVGDSSFQSNANLTVNGVAVLQDCALECGQYSDITVLVPVYPFATTSTTSTTNGGKSGEEGVVVPPLAIHLSSTMGSTGTSHKKDATRLSYVKSLLYMLVVLVV
jgi:hypothetical protein